jgi:hypothetical protein
MRVFTQLSIASFAALSISTAIPLHRRSDVLDVKLTATGNTLVKASITNTGSTPLNLFNKGTFLDSAAVEKVTVSANGMLIYFLSHHLYLSLFVGHVLDWSANFSEQAGMCSCPKFPPSQTISTLIAHPGVYRSMLHIVENTRRPLKRIDIKAH